MCLCYLTLKSAFSPLSLCLIHVAEADWLKVPEKSAREAIKMFQQYLEQIGGEGSSSLVFLRRLRMTQTFHNINKCVRPVI